MSRSFIMAGTIGIQNPLAILFTQSTAGAAANNFTVTRPVTVVDATVICRAAQAGGTALIGKGAAAISDAIICAVDGVVTRIGTLDDANQTLVSGDSLRITTAGAATVATVSVTVIPTPIADLTTVA